ncbi:MAG: hypothetical protein R2809_10270 [Flavobacteriales bacterium]
MTKLSLLSLLLLSLSFTQAPSLNSVVLRDYYILVHKAEWYVYQGDTLSALENYQKAFEIKLPFLIDLNNARSLLQGGEFSDDKTIALISEDWRNIDAIFYRNKSRLDVSNFQLTSNYLWQKSIDIATYNSRYAYHEALKTIIDEDQFLRQSKISGNRDSVLALHGIEHFKKFQELVSMYGWPSPEKDGEFNTLIYPVLLHGTYYCGLDGNFKDLMFQAVMCGELNSHFYAKVCDRFCDWNLSIPQDYGEWQTTTDGSIRIREVQNLDLRRDSIFLEPYKQYCLKNKLPIPEGYE